MSRLFIKIIHTKYTANTGYVPRRVSLYYYAQCLYIESVPFFTKILNVTYGSNVTQI